MALLIYEKMPSNLNRANFSYFIMAEDQNLLIHDDTGLHSKSCHFFH